MEIYGYAPFGYEGHLVRIEVDLRKGIPGLEIVGLPGSAVREARERIRIALHRSGFHFPPERILINLAPADLPKVGSGYDLPLALALLEASGQWVSPFPALLAMGELSLDGRVQAVPGILAGAVRACSAGVGRMAVPAEAIHEVSRLPGIGLFAGTTLAEVVHSLRLETPVMSPVMASAEPFPGTWTLKGQPRVVRALQAAAAGRHSLLLYGPPGGGKTLAARSLELLMPPLEADQALETSRLWSLAGKWSEGGGLLEGAPLRDPHHSASAEGLLGGGISLMPGEISLAHNGVLFLDEAPEFSPRVLQALREPLEQGRIQVARAGRSTWFPSRFLLALTANCCPCGQRGKERGVCFCSAQEVRRYWDRIGNALMDRIDLRVFVRPASTEAILHEPVPSLAAVRAPIHRAGTLKRLRAMDGENEGLTLPKADRAWLAERAALEDWSTRGLQSVLRVARTLADLDETPGITPVHLNEAAMLRTGSGREPWLE